MWCYQTIHKEKKEWILIITQTYHRPKDAICIFQMCWGNHFKCILCAWVFWQNNIENIKLVSDECTDGIEHLPPALEGSMYQFNCYLATQHSGRVPTLPCGGMLLVMMNNVLVPLLVFVSMENSSEMLHFSEKTWKYNGRNCFPKIRKCFHICFIKKHTM